MTYCTLSDVYPLLGAIGPLSDGVTSDLEAEPPVVGSPATPCTATMGEALVVQVSAEIDAHLRAAGYVVPATGGTAEATLKAYCMSGAAGRILRSMFPAAEGVGGEKGSAAAHERDYANGLALIDRGGLAADVVAATGSSNVTDGFPERHHHHYYEGCD